MFPITYHPHPDEQTKMIKRTLYHMLRYFIFGKSKVWEDLFLHIDFFLTYIVNFSTSHTPFAQHSNKGQKEMIFAPGNWL